MFASEPGALKIIAGLAEGLTPAKSAGTYVMTELEYETTRKRMRRKRLRLISRGAGRIESEKIGVPPYRSRTADGCARRDILGRNRRRIRAMRRPAVGRARAGCVRTQIAAASGDKDTPDPKLPLKRRAQGVLAASIEHDRLDA